MNVHRSKPGDVDDRRRKELAVRRDHLHVRRKGAKRGLDIGLAHAPRLSNGEAEPGRLDLDRRCSELSAAAALTVGLGHHRGNVVPAFEEGHQEGSRRPRFP